MRILINAVSAKAGGGITYLVNLLKYLPGIMPEDDFLCVIQDIDLPTELYLQKNLEIRKIPQASGNVLKRYWWENTGLLKLCKTWKADLLYCIANMIPLIPSGRPTYMMLQNVAPITPSALTAVLKHEGIKPFLQMVANCVLTLYAAAFSHKTFVLSQSSDSLIKKWIPFVKTSIVHHGISSHFRPESKKPEKAGNEPYYIFVSNIYVYKGLDYIVEAYKTNRELPHIFIVGHAFDVNYTTKIKQNIKDSNLEDKIIFLDSLPYSELPGWYANAIANVFPTWCESFGCGIIEAQACSCPIVGMQAATLPEFCGETGILVKAYDGKALAEGMKKAIELKNDASLASKLSEYSKSFTWQAAMEKHRDCFREVDTKQKNS